MFRRLSKNLYVRLAALALLAGLGGLAIYQSLPSGETEVAQAEPAEKAEVKEASLLLLDDPSEPAADSPQASDDDFRMPPPEESIVRANNDDTPAPPSGNPSPSVYGAGTPQPAPIPAYGQPPADAVSAYAPASANAMTDADSPTGQSPVSQPPVPQPDQTLQAEIAANGPPVDPTAELNPRYQPPATDAVNNPAPAPSYPTESAAASPAVAAGQASASPLRMQAAPQTTASAANPTGATKQPTPAAPATDQYQSSPAYGNNSYGQTDSTVAAEPGPLPTGTDSPASAAGGQPPVAYNLEEDGGPRRPIAVPEGSERYGQLPPDGLDQLAGQGVGTPGDRNLEGPQTPNIRIEKVAPPEIQVGKAARFEIKVMNSGNSTAHEVVVLDELPRGVRFVSAAPPADQAADGALMWQLGALRSGEESTISLEVMPLEEGEIGSVATVSFQAQASVRTRCTRPQLALEHTAPKKVLIGQPVTLAISLSNPGTGAATGVMIEENVPAGLSHAAGKLLEYEVGTLRPGETRQLELTLKAEQPGLIDQVVIARGEGSLEVEHRVQIEVIAPQLELAMSGPKLRYLDRQATYTISASNAGTAPASDVEIVTRLPRGMKFLAADNEGQYDSASHAVYWSLKELPAETAGQMQVTTLPVEVGEQKLRVDGQAALGLKSTAESLVAVEALAELFFTVTDAADPIEVGKETVYEIRVVNQGSKVAQNVVATALLPQDMEAVNGDGPTRASQEGGRIVFEPLPRLAPKQEAVYKIRVQGKRAGDHRITVQVVSDDTTAPVTKEESTRVYSDQ
jgi:uncharacterized repeat protein (TIGR01451 family)